jgi:O-antigen/teichoic acid export membrane protein
VTNNLLTQKFKSVYYWFKDEQFQRLINNVQKLFGGDLVRHVFKLISISLTARALGAELFGTLVLIRTYTRIIDQFVNFQSWQGFIKFGEKFKEQNRKKFLDTIRICTQIDFFSAVLGTILSCVLLFFVGDLYELNFKIKFLAYLYALSILFNIEGTPTGILRIYDKYALYAYQRIITSTVQVLIIGSLFIFGINELVYYVVAWLITEILQHLLLFYVGWKELISRGISLNCLFRIDFSNSRSLLKFVGITNVQSSVKLGAKQIDTMIVGYMLGSQAVGIFDIAKRFSSVLSKITNPVYQAIYPDLSRMWVEKKTKDFKTLIIKSGLLFGIVAIFAWLFFVLFGKSVLAWTVGGEFMDSYPVLILYMVGIVISIFSLPLHPALLAMNKPEVSLYAITVSTFIYLGSIFVTLNSFGIHGVGYSFILFYLVWTIFTFIFVFKQLLQNKNIS